MTSPAISVIVPYFNAAATIRATLDSVRRQTFRSFEMIVVDDGSEEVHASSLDSIASDFNDLTIIRTTNRGVAAARNTGIASSSGEFIAPLDADDIWHPTYLEKMVSAISASGEQIAIVYAPSRIIDANTQVLSSMLRPRIHGPAAHRVRVKNVSENGSSIVYRKSAGDAFGHYNESFPRLSDFTIIVDLCDKGEMSTVPEYLVGYTHTEASLSKSPEGQGRELLKLVAGSTADRPQAIVEALHIGLVAYLGWYAKRNAKSNPALAIQLFLTALWLAPSRTLARLYCARHETQVAPEKVATFLEFDLRHPALLEPGDHRSPPEFRWAELQDGAVSRH